jgi:hypothetical protein
VRLRGGLCRVRQRLLQGDVCGSREQLLLREGHDAVRLGLLLQRHQLLRRIPEHLWLSGRHDALRPEQHPHVRAVGPIL